MLVVRIIASPDSDQFELKLALGNLSIRVSHVAWPSKSIHPERYMYIWGTLHFSSRGVTKNPTVSYIIEVSIHHGMSIERVAKPEDRHKIETQRDKLERVRVCDEKLFE